MKSESDGHVHTMPEAPVDAADSQWMRLPPPKGRLWGLSRTTWVELLESGKVSGVNIKKKRFAKRGIRLIHRPSAEAYLRSLLPTNAGTEAHELCT